MQIRVYLMIAKEVCPEIERHVSTQANNTNYGTYHVLVSDRGEHEWYLQENFPCMRSKKSVHISRMIWRLRHLSTVQCVFLIPEDVCSVIIFTGRDANHGACTHPCRWKYSVVEETRPGEYMPVYENERGTYIFNSKDLCMIEHIPELIDAGIDSFKIEGRMKTALYVATVARTYRKAIDDYQKDPELYRKNMPWYLDQISNCTYRQFTTGFFFGKPDRKRHRFMTATPISGSTHILESQKRLKTVW